MLIVPPSQHKRCHVSVFAHCPCSDGPTCSHSCGGFVCAVLGFISLNVTAYTFPSSSSSSRRRPGRPTRTPHGAAGGEKPLTFPPRGARGNTAYVRSIHGRPDEGLLGCD